MEGKQYQFNVNTSNICLFCLNGYSQNSSTGIDLDNCKSFSIMNLFRYLNINLSEVTSFPKKSSSLLSQTDIRASLCVECEPLMEQFSEHYKAMELSRMRLDFTLELISQSLNHSTDDPNRIIGYQKTLKEDPQALKHSKLFAEIREKVMNKSNKKLYSRLPHIKLEKMKTVPVASTISTTIIKSLTPSPEDFHKVEQDDPQPNLEVDSIPIVKFELIKSVPYDDDFNFFEEDRGGFENFLEFETNQSMIPPAPILPTQTTAPPIALQIRDAAHTNDKKKSFSCDICLKTFDKKTQYLTHLKWHRGTAFTCQVCSVPFRAQSILDVHLRSHTDERTFKCHLCPEAFKSQVGLAYHVEVTHLYPKIKKIPKRSKKCHVCGKVLHTTLTVHMRTHTGERPFKCDLCPKGFVDQSSLSRHRRIHTGEKLYECILCPKRFSDQSNFHKHNMVCHKGQNCYRCNICESMFVHWRLLRNHQKEEMHGKAKNKSK